MSQRHRIAVLGLGRGGSRIAAALKTLDTGADLEVAVADTDLATLESHQHVTTISLGQEWTRREGTGGDAMLGERAASASLSALREFMTGSRLVIVVAGLGGGTGGGAGKVVARLARESETTVLFLVTLPFSFEGNWRQQAARKCLAPLREFADAVIVIPNDLLFSVLPAHTAATEAFQLADVLLAEGLGGLARIALSEGLVTADFASLRALLHQRQATCSLGVGRGEGDRRWQDAVESFLDCPLVGGRETLAATHSAIVTLLGGNDLSIGEIQTVLPAFQEHFPDSAQVVVGAYADARFAGRLQITALLCRYEDAPPTESRQPLTVAQSTVKAGKGRKAQKAKSSEIQGELPLLEQTLGLFSGTTPTTALGQNLDIPTFQRKGIQLDIGEAAP